MSATPDYDQIRTALSHSLPQGSTFEIRRLQQYRGLAEVGYFKDIDTAANLIVNSDNTGIAGTYVTLNPVNPELMARVSDRLIGAKGGLFTTDSEITHRVGFLLDFDPVRVSGISSTDAEHEEAIAFAKYVGEQLTAWWGFPTPALIDSGNGAHCRYAVNVPNDEHHKLLFRDALRCIKHMYPSKTVDIDVSVFNAARIVRLPGTVARKGEDTPLRPHRTSRVLRDYDPFDMLTVDRIETLVKLNKDKVPQRVRKTPAGRPVSAYEYPVDENQYRKLQNAARERLHEWVPSVFAGLAHPSGDGYRIKSSDLGRDLEEDISIRADTGVKDFGVHDMGDETEGRRTYISLIAELITNGDKREAARMIGNALNHPTTEFEGVPIMRPMPSSGLPDLVNPTMPDELLGTYETPDIGKHALTLATVNGMKFEEPEYLVEDWIEHGTHTVISADSKMGKTTLVRQLILSVASGMPFLDLKTLTGKVMYIGYEERLKDFQRNMKRELYATMDRYGIEYDDAEIAEIASRIICYCCDMKHQPGQGDFKFPQGSLGVQALTEFIKQNPDVKLIVLDPMRLFHGDEVYSRDLVTQQYTQITMINDIAYATGVSIVSIHHNSKGKGDDNNFTSKAGGTVAQTAAPSASLFIIGKKVKMGKQPPRELALSSRALGSRYMVIDFEHSIWYKAPQDTVVPAASPGAKNEEVKQKVRVVLSKQPGLTGAEISAVLGLHPQNGSPILREMCENGELTRIRRDGRTYMHYLTHGPSMPGTALMPDVL